MVNAALGILESDFTDNALFDLGQTVNRTPRTKTTSNSTGSPTYTDGTPADIQAIFTHRGQDFDWAKEGLFEGGDAFMQVDKDQALNKEDIILVAGKKYRVDTIIGRQAGGLAMFKSCNLFLVE